MLLKKALQSGLMLAICMMLVLTFQHFGLQSNIYFMGIGAIVTINHTKDQGLRSGIERLVGCISGGIIGLLFMIIYNQVNIIYIAPILCFVGAVILVLFNGKLNNQSGTLEALIMFATLITNIGTANNIYQYTILRIIDTLIGFVVGVIINQLIFKNY